MPVSRANQLYASTGKCAESEKRGQRHALCSAGRASFIDLRLLQDAELLGSFARRPSAVRRGGMRAFLGDVGEVVFFGVFF